MTETPRPDRRGEIPKIRLGEEPAESTRIRAAPNEMPAPSGRDRPFLIVIGGGATGEMFPLREREVVIGRSREAAIQFDDDDVSRRHARIVRRGKDLEIEDLGSANGTFVNGARVEARRALADGDKISLGSVTVLKFTYNDELDETFQRRMFDASLRDGMTKAYNKNYLLERLDKELAFSRRHRTPLSLVMLDIDHFKQVNDQYGHPCGDAVLVNVSRAVLDTLRKEDIFARYGGEEFAIACRGLDLTNAARLAERLRQIVAGVRTPARGRDLAVTASFGVAGGLELTVETAMQLIQAADEALYEAKRAGRNRIATRP